MAQSDASASPSRTEADPTVLANSPESMGTGESSTGDEVSQGDGTAPTQG